MKRIQHRWGHCEDGQLRNKAWCRIYSLDPEYPSPGCVIGNYAAQDGAQDARHSYHRPNPSSDPLLRLLRAHFGEDDHGEGVETRATYSLQCSEDNEFIDAVCKAAAD